MTNQISVVVNNDNRARNIAIGFLVVSVLTYWHFTGSLPLLATSIVPQPEDAKLQSTWSFGVELLGDLFYFVGVAATGFASGIWTMIIGLIRLLVAKSNSQPAAQVTPMVTEQTVTRELLDKRTKQVFSAIEKPLNELSEQLKTVQEQLAIMSKPTDIELAKPATARRTVRRKAQA
jgi:hypothetical protein